MSEKDTGLDIIMVFKQLSSLEAKSFLVDMSVFSESVGGRIEDVLGVAQKVDTPEKLQKALDELEPFGLVQRGRLDRDRGFVESTDGDRLRLAKGVQSEIRQKITKEIP